MAKLYKYKLLIVTLIISFLSWKCGTDPKYRYMQDPDSDPESSSNDNQCSGNTFGNNSFGSSTFGGKAFGGNTFDSQFNVTSNNFANNQFDSNKWQVANVEKNTQIAQNYMKSMEKAENEWDKNLTEIDDNFQKVSETALADITTFNNNLKNIDDKLAKVDSLDDLLGGLVSVAKKSAEVVEANSKALADVHQERNQVMLDTFSGYMEQRGQAFEALVQEEKQLQELENTSHQGALDRRKKDHEQSKQEKEDELKLRQNIHRSKVRAKQEELRLQNDQNINELQIEATKKSNAIEIEQKLKEAQLQAKAALNQEERHEKELNKNLAAKREQEINLQALEKIKQEEEAQRLRNSQSKYYETPTKRGYSTDATGFVTVYGSGQVDSNFKLIFYSNYKKRFRIELVFKDKSRRKLHSWMTPDIELNNKEDRTETYPPFNISQNLVDKIHNVELNFRWAVIR